MNGRDILAGIPEQIRKELIREYNELVERFVEGRWLPSELFAGRFCEVVFTILKDMASGQWSDKPTKPKDFVSSCRGLENNTNIPESFRFHILKFLPVLYDVRNKRGVGHVGGDVDPNYMDASLCVSGATWIMGELIRYFHGVSTQAAQAAVTKITTVRYPLVWVGRDMRRVLDPSLLQADQILLLLASASGPVTDKMLMAWLDIAKRSNLLRVLKTLHSSRMVEAAVPDVEIVLLPPGAKRVHELTSRHSRAFSRAA